MFNYSYFSMDLGVIITLVRDALFKFFTEIGVSLHELKTEKIVD